jgi:RNA polymerase sigma factor (sigma-70 family)
VTAALRPTVSPWDLSVDGKAAPSEASEDELCGAALAGDRSAWNILIARHDRRVFVSLLARGLAPDRARDVAQQAWMTLMDQQRKGRLGALLLPALAVKQAAFIALEDARSARSRRPHLSIEHDRPELEDDAEVERVVLCREQLTRARARLRTMHPHAQAVFRLTYETPPLSCAEIAARLGLSLQRVRQIACEVRSELRAAIGEPAFDEARARSPR